MKLPALAGSSSMKPTRHIPTPPTNRPTTLSHSGMIDIGYIALLAQIGPMFGLLGTVDGMVMAFDVAGLPVAQTALEVRTQVTISKLAGVYV